VASADVKLNVIPRSFLGPKHGSDPLLVDWEGIDALVLSFSMDSEKVVLDVVMKSGLQLVKLWICSNNGASSANLVCCRVQLDRGGAAKKEEKENAREVVKMEERERENEVVEGKERFELLLMVYDSDLLSL